MLGNPHHDMHALRRECHWGVCIVRSAADSVLSIYWWALGLVQSSIRQQKPLPTQLELPTPVAIASRRRSVGHPNFLAPLYIVCRSMILGEELDLRACSDTCRKSYIPA